MFNIPLIPQGGQPIDFTGSNVLSYYTTDTTKRFEYGQGGMTWDGKVFRYSLATATLSVGYGAFNGANATVSRLINSVTPVAYVAGQRQIKVTIAATEGQSGNGVVATNELIGALIVIGHGAQATAETRTVMGNTAVASGGGTTTVTLDYPLALAHTAGVACELPLNPYRYLINASEYASVMCVPNIYVTTGYNFWGQTRGRCWCVPGGGDPTPGNTVNDRMAYFVGDGSVNFGTAITIETGYQFAGFCVDTTESGTSAMPVIQLMLE